MRPRHKQHLFYQTNEAASQRSRHNNRDVVSTSRKQDSVRDTPDSIDPNQEVSLTRSPPPKRTREGVTLHHEENRATDEMQMDENDTLPMALLDTTSDFGSDNNTETSNEEIEYEWSSQEEEEACTNLSDRFNAATTDDTVSGNGTPIHATSPTSVTPRATNVNVLQSVHCRNNPRHTPAPLGPQYTSEMGPAGAADPGNGARRSDS